MVITMEETKTIGKEYSTKELIKFVSGPIATQILLSLLMSLDDGLFISRFIGPEALAAFSVLYPMFTIFEALICLFLASSTYCSSLLGEKKNKEANSAFSTSIVLAIFFALGVTIITKIFINPILDILGCTKLLWPYCNQQFNAQIWFTVTAFLTRIFTAFYIVAGKPKVATITSIVAMVVNVLFDYIFVVRMKLGMAGTAYANGIGHIVNIIYGLYFFTRKDVEIKLVKPNYDLKVLILKLMKIGLPRTITSLTISITSIIGHRIILIYSDETALTANSIINSLQFMFMSGYFGLADAISPLIGYAYGEKNSPKLKRVIKQFLEITFGLSIIIVGLYIVFKKPLVWLYLNEKVTQELIDMINYGLMIAPYAFIFLGFSVFGQTIFTDTQNSSIATFLTVMENVVISNLTVIIIPYFFGIKGFWYCFLITEVLTSIVTYITLKKYRYKFENL